MMADFQNGLISRIFTVFGSGFLHKTTLNVSTMDFDMFLAILILTQSEDFAWAIAFA